MTAFDSAQNVAAGKTSTDDGQAAILFGADDARKAHASRLTEADLEPVDRAAY